ncbi:MAG: DUF512 domain-containing protein [Lachnospiraceae bacterium]|nr:DUF512 domain-containing protein [Lachnospiraceae bacterium]
MADSTVIKGKLIKAIAPGSAAEEAGITEGDILLLVNGERIGDIFDYQYECQDTEVEFLIKHEDGSEESYLLEKGEDEDPGLIFEDGIMDDYRRCRNKCIFCFIDQMPEGMRDTLYFKDDDSRLSFLQGNYVTLTNMSDDDIDRIIRYNLGPINISFQTTNPKLRCMMMGNRFAGEALEKADRLFEAGISMNGQIVLCKGINDGEELERSISDLTKYIPVLESVSVVPVGLSKFRDGLYPLEPFTKEDAVKVVGQIEKWQKKLYKKHGIHFIHASDEWYINAGIPIPEASRYDDYLQLENGVGMVRLLIDEFEEEVRELSVSKKKGSFSMITGRLIYPVIRSLADRMKEIYPNMEARVYEIRNDFFGERITVTGLLTGQDILSQLKDKELGERLYIPQNVLRANTEVLLDDTTVSEISEKLGVPVNILGSDGASFTGMYANF